MNTWFHGKREFRHSWRRPGGESSLKDLVMGSEQLMEHITVVKTIGTRCSDHRLVVCRAKASLFSSTTPVRSRHAKRRRSGKVFEAVNKDQTTRARQRPHFGSSQEEKAGIRAKCQTWWSQNGSTGDFCDTLLKCQKECCPAINVPLAGAPPSDIGSEFTRWTSETLRASSSKKAKTSFLIGSPSETGFLVPRRHVNRWSRSVNFPS